MKGKRRGIIELIKLNCYTDIPSEVIRKIAETAADPYIVDGGSHLVTFLNPYSYYIARRRKEFLSFDHIYLDGLLAVFVLKVGGLSRVYRSSFDMTSIAPIVFEKALESGSRIYIVGSSMTYVEKAVTNIRRLFPGINIIGYRHGYFNSDCEYHDSLNAIIEAKADIVICGMGTPLQESFLVSLREMGWGGTGYTCGGFLHQMAKKTTYYPLLIDRLQLRWIYRVIDEPRKVLSRLVQVYPKFLWLVLGDIIRYSRISKKNHMSQRDTGSILMDEEEPR
jgi:exopolysaccharide biosynthesis WecB/TagA/CpsF family protein